MDINEKILFSEIEKLALKFRNDISHFALDYEELVRTFHQYVGRLVQYNPLNLYDNPLSLLINDCLGDSISYQFNKEFRKYESDPEYSEKFNGLIDYYQECINEGYGISDEEFYELYRLVKVYKRNDSTYIRYLLSQVIEGNNSIDLETYKGLLESFVKGIIKKNKLNVCFRIGKLEDATEDEIADTIYRYGTYYVTYDSRKLNPDSVLENLEFIFHEIWHTVQDSDDYSSSNLIDLFKKDDYIRRNFGEDYYDDNYRLISYEVDADLHAVIMLGQLLRRISPETYEMNKKILENKLKRSNELLYNRKRTFRGEEYDIDVLFDRARSKCNQTSEDVLGGCQDQKKLLKIITI